MAATSRSGAKLARLAAPSMRTALSARTFSTSIPLRANDADGKPPPRTRSNPLIGNYTPARPAKLDERAPPVSTEHPRSSHPPHPARPPQSSAEVPPNADMPPPPPPQASQATAETPAAPKKAHPYSAADSSRPHNIDISAIIGDRSAADAASKIDTDPTTQPSIYPKAVTGRTIFVRPRGGPDSASSPSVALQKLARLAKMQKVRSKYHSQRFHERRGAKKKRLRSERWRYRFLTGFRATVQRVVDLKKQGW